MHNVFVVHDYNNSSLTDRLNDMQTRYAAMSCTLVLLLIIAKNFSAAVVVVVGRMDGGGKGPNISHMNRRQTVSSACMYSIYCKF